MPDSLEQATTREGFANTVVEIIRQLGRAADEAAAIELLHLAKVALGAEHAVFVSYVRDDDSQESFRFLLACDPVWCLEYQQQGWYAHDAWLLYAATNSEPVPSSRIPTHTRAQRDAKALAAKFGIVSAYIVPAPASGGLSRLGVLILGSSQAGYYESESADLIKGLARGLSMELHEWWVRKVRREIITLNRISPEDLQLLALERQGLGTKEIAEELGATPSSVDSRFQRLSTKFNMPNRRATARVAAEYGLI